MKIGAFATFMSPLATPQMISEFGRRAENMGLDSICMGAQVSIVYLYRVAPRLLRLYVVRAEPQSNQDEKQWRAKISSQHAF
jgi:hypothetical protein